MSTPTLSITNSVALQSFRTDLGVMWSSLRPLCVDPGTPERLQRDLRSRTSSTLAGDLEALLAGWHHFGPGHRAVLAGAVGFLCAGPTEVDHACDELVVRAAVRAVLRRR